MIEILNEQQCYELLTATTVGRVGFVEEDRVQILPVNYVVSDRRLLLRTSSDGILRALAATPTPVAFEVDHHNDIAGSGWSVLMHGTLSTIDDASPIVGRVSPWAGGSREVPLSFSIDSLSGRSVLRDRRP